MKMSARIVLIFVLLGLTAAAAAAEASLVETEDDEPKIMCPALAPQCVCNFRDEIECNNFRNFSELTFQSLATTFGFSFVRLRPNLRLSVPSNFQFTWFKVLDGAELILENLFEIQLSANPFASTNKFDLVKIENTVFNVPYDDDSRDCLRDQLGSSRKRFMSSFNRVKFLGDKNSFPNPICPLFFKDAEIESIEFDSVSDDRFPKFLPPPTSSVINSQIRRLQIRNGNISRLSLEFINPVVFGSLQSLVLAEVDLKSIDQLFFPAFKQLAKVSISAIDLGQIFRNDSNKWLESLQQVESSKLEILLIDEYGRYDFPDQHFCTFKLYPQDGRVTTQIYSLTQKIECTCTYVWLVKSSSSQALNCSTTKSLAEWVEDCRFDSKLYECDPTTEPSTEKQTTPEPSTPEPKPVLGGPVELYIVLAVGLIISFLIMIVSLRYLQNGALLTPALEPLIPENFFNESGGTLRQGALLEHEILFKNGNGYPGFHTQDYSYFAKTIESQIEKLVKRGFIKHLPNQSPSTSLRWLSPIVFDPERPRFGFFVDYRELNRSTKREKLFLPELDRTTDLLSKAQYYSTIDLSYGIDLDSFNYKIRLSEDSKDLTTFRALDGTLYQFEVVPFGLSNYRCTVKKVIDEVLKNQINKTCVLDVHVNASGAKHENCCRLIVFGSSLQDHRNNLVLVLHQFKRFGVRFSKEAVSVEPTRSVYYVSKKISQGSVSEVSVKSSSLSDFENTLSYDSLRHVAGLLDFFKERVDGYASLKSVIEGHVSSGRLNIKSRTVLADMQKVTKAIDQQMSDPVATLKRLIVYVTATSDFYFAILAQFPDDRRLAMISKIYRQLPKDQLPRRTEQETSLDALFWALRQFRGYIFNQHVTLCLHFNSDVDYVIKGHALTPKQLTKILQLGEYDFRHEIDAHKDSLAKVCDDYVGVIQSSTASTEL